MWIKDKIIHKNPHKYFGDTQYSNVLLGMLSKCLVLFIVLLKQFTSYNNKDFGCLIISLMAFLQIIFYESFSYSEQNQIWLEAVSWNKNITCEQITEKKVGVYHCLPCKIRSNVTCFHTIFKISLRRCKVRQWVGIAVQLLKRPPEASTSRV